MAFTRKNFDRVWTKAEDFPTYQDSEEQVRADLQYHPDALLRFLGSLMAELEAKGAAASLGATSDTGVATTIQSVLNSHAETMSQLAEDIKNAASGGVPSLVRSSEVGFLASSWETSGSSVSLTINKADHKRENSAFGYNLYQKVGSEYRSSTWGTAGTRVVYDPDDESITLTADEAYAGKIVFFGM